MAAFYSNQQLAIIDGTQKGTNIETFLTWKELAQTALCRLTIEELAIIRDEFIPELVTEKLE